MIAVDTNVLLRLVVADDATQAKKARALFDEHEDESDAIWIADVVLAELVWALDRTYGRSRPEIVAVLRALDRNATVNLESASALKTAIELYEAGPADFVDCLLAIKAQAVPCETLRTFDRKMRQLPGVSLL